jgi:hypothetical protein
MHFRAYMNNFNRVRMVELIDYHNQALRTQKLRASLVVNPLTGLPYYATQDQIEFAARTPPA